MALSLFLGRFVGDFFSPPLSLPLPSRISVTRLGHMARAQAALRRRKRKKGQGMRGLYLASRVSTFHRRGVALFQTQPYSAELCQTGNKGTRTCPCTCGQRQPG